MTDVFERSPQGIANRAIFFGVDLVAYHESNHEDGVDNYFWSALFSKYAPHLKVKFLPSGSKSEVKGVYSIYSAADNGTSKFLLDRDMDEVTGSLIADKSVVYTYGYSCENDISREKTIAEVAHNFVGGVISKSALEIAATEAVASLHSLLSRILRIDQIAKLNGALGVGRAGYRRFLSDVAYGSPPEIDRSAVNSFVSSVRAHVGKKCTCPHVVRKRSHWRRNLVGHMVFSIYYKIVTWLVQIHAPSTKLKKIDVKRMMVSVTLRSLAAKISRESSAYYRGVFRAI